jgi:hypothetical protein
MHVFPKRNQEQEKSKQHTTKNHCSQQAARESHICQSTTVTLIRDIKKLLPCNYAFHCFIYIFSSKQEKVQMVPEITHTFFFVLRKRHGKGNPHDQRR